MKYIYDARDKTGQSTTGTVEAKDIESAQKSISKHNLFVTKIRKLSDGPSYAKLFSGVSMKDKLIFTEETAVMIRSGFPITKALSTISEQVTNRKFKEVLTDVESQISGGQSLANSLARHPRIFPELYTEVIASGEESGNLDKILDRLAADMRKSYELNNKIRSAMVYPIFVLGVIILILSAMLVFVLPQLRKLFEDIDIALPATTRALLLMSDIFIHYWWALIVFIALAVISFNAYYKTRGGKLFIDMLKIKVIIFGPINKNIYMARFTRTLNTLLAAGLPVLDTFKTLEKTVGNQVYAVALAKAREDIEGGETISGALSKSSLFSPFIIQLVRVGEESGNISSTLDTLSNFIEQEIDNSTKSLSALIEPLLILILGVGAGFIVTAIILPIYSLTDVIT
jgi:type IV pilus assembly protein PilC